MGRIVIVAYRPRSGAEQQLLELVKEHVPILRQEGLATTFTPLVLRTADGTTRWHASVGGVSNTPVTIEIDGRQHLLVGGGGVLYAWRLPN